MKGHARDVSLVTVKGQKRVRVGGADVVEFDIGAAGGSEPALVGRDAETVNLRVGMLDRPRTDSGQSFPEADRMVIARYGTCAT